MYKIEIFTQQLQAVDVAPIASNTTIAEDYLTLNTYTVNIFKSIPIKRGYFTHITDDNNATIADGVVKDVQYIDKITVLTVAPLIALLDKESPNVIHTDSTASEQLDGGCINIVSVEMWLSGEITRLLNSMSIPNRVIAFADAGAVTAFNGEAVANIFDVYRTARSLHGVNINMYLQFDNPTAPVMLRVLIAQITGANEINADLANVAEKDINVSTEDGAINRVDGVLYQQEPEGFVSGAREVRYYRFVDGSIGTEGEGVKIEPEIIATRTLKKDPNKTDAENLQALAELCAEALTIGEFSNEIYLTMSVNDRLIPPSYVTSKVYTYITSGGNVYASIYTGYERTGDMIKYKFGNVRTDLTSKLLLEKRA